MVSECLEWGKSLSPGEANDVYADLSGVQKSYVNSTQDQNLEVEATKDADGQRDS